ncbi:MBL fold metallo-hydrolase [Candidatus Woesearchaeota archaeon]|nr:MBL fold metallo-hydrolase [Candidatus Woesearchaeota archaeon]
MKIYTVLLLMVLIGLAGCVKDNETSEVARLDYSFDRNLSSELFSVHYLGYSSFLIQEKENSTAIYFNPYHLREGLPKADYILITNPDADVCSLPDVEKLVKQYTTVVTTPDCKDKLSSLQNSFIAVKPGDIQMINDDIIIISTPAYNLNPERGHPQEKNWVGFFIKYHNRYYYHAGDTDYLPFMKELGRVHVAMLPVNGIDSMSVEETINATYDIDALSSVAMDYLEKTDDPDEIEEKWLEGVKFGFPFVMKPYE